MGLRRPALFIKEGILREKADTTLPEVLTSVAQLAQMSHLQAVCNPPRGILLHNHHLRDRLVLPLHLVELVHKPEKKSRKFERELGSRELAWFT